MGTAGTALASLFFIVIISFVAPYVASLIPGRPVPETVFLVFAGTLFGPYGLGLIHPSLDSIQLLSQLGCAFLFLMAGYEINVSKLTGPMGRHASLVWAISLAIALGIVQLLPLRGATGEIGRLAFAIAMTTTAFGTLAPIMRDRALEGTAVGDAVVAYGATGEVLPVVAMGILLSTRGTWVSIASLVIFALVCLDVLRRTRRAKARGAKIVSFIRDNAETGSQAMVRAVVLLLILLVFLAHVVQLDIVLGAFAAGFILRAIVPDGDHLLEKKLDALSFGFLVPLFFVVSGTQIDVTAVAESPVLFVGFIFLLLLVRALPVFISLRVWPESRDLSVMECFSTSMYCSMALPVIVAVTGSAVDAGAMSESMASVLVTAGAFTVLAVPLITSLTRHIEAVHPVQAVKEIAHHTSDLGEVMHTHRLSHSVSAEEFRRARAKARSDGRRLSSADFLATRHTSSRDDENT